MFGSQTNQVSFMSRFDKTSLTLLLVAVASR